MDLYTLYAVVGTTSLLIGLVGIAVHATRRFGKWPLWWGASNLLVGIGDLVMALPPSRDVPAVGTVCNIAVVAGYVLLLGGVRDFARRELPAWVAAAAVVAAVAPFCFDRPGDVGLQISISSAVLAAFDLAVAFEVARLANNEHLGSGWIMAALFLVSGGLFVARSAFLASGAFGQSAPLGTGWQTQALVAIPAAGILMLRGMALLLLATERHHRRMEALAFRDPLTGSLTRQGIRHAKEILLQGARRRNLSASVLLIDVDRFKEINDTQGHAVGDEVLRQVAEATRSVLPNGGFVARWGGDEFVALLPATGAQEALEVAEALREQLRGRAGSDGPMPVTLSIGIATGRLRVGGLDCLLEGADAALYEVKRSGRDGASISDRCPCASEFDSSSHHDQTESASSSSSRVLHAR